MNVMQDNRSDLDRAFDLVINRIVTPLLTHRDEICRSEGWTDEMAKGMVTDTILAEVRDNAKRELAAIYCGVGDIEKR
jgi:hypothetical protein